MEKANCRGKKIIATVNWEAWGRGIIGTNQKTPGKPDFEVGEP
jgi:hypothetical protein